MTALTGAGPAFPALLASAMLAHAKKRGIADDIAFEAVMQTLVGGSQLLEHLNSDPGEMVQINAKSMGSESLILRLQKRRRLPVTT